MSLTEDARAYWDALDTSRISSPWAAFLAGAGWAAAQTAQPSVEDVARVLGQNLRDTVGDCVCGDAYTERDLVDPNCGWHLAEGTADDDSARAVVALLPGTPAAQIRAEALRDAAVELFGDVTAERGTTKAMNHAIYATWLLGRADEEAES